MSVTNVFLQKERPGPIPPHVRAMTCDLVEQLVRAYARPQIPTSLKLDIVRKARLVERFQFLESLNIQWATIGYYAEGEDERVEWVEYIRRNLTLAEVRTTFKIFSSCGCCARHNDLHGINRLNYCQNCRTCKCRCRHHARRMAEILIRENRPVPPSDDLAETDEVELLRTWEEQRVLPTSQE